MPQSLAAAAGAAVDRVAPRASAARPAVRAARRPVSSMGFSWGASVGRRAARGHCRQPGAGAWRNRRTRPAGSSECARALPVRAVPAARPRVVAYGPTLVSSIGYGAVLPVARAARPGPRRGRRHRRARRVAVRPRHAARLAAVRGDRRPARASAARCCTAGSSTPSRWRPAAPTDGARPRHRGRGQRDGVDGVPDRPAGLHDRGRPAGHRARAMSTLGGTFRIGIFVGPLLGAAADPRLRHRPRSSCWLAALSVAAALMAQLMPDLGPEGRARAARRRPRVGAVGAGRAPAHPADPGRRPWS